MPVVATLTRKQLYDEIWEISATKVAEKYGIPYIPFKKQLNDADIPAPPSGYWTKISFGQSVEKTPLPGDPQEIVTLRYTPSGRERTSEKAAKFGTFTAEQLEQLANADRPPVQNAVPQEPPAPKPKPPKKSDHPSPEAEALSKLPPPKVVQQWGAVYNVYDRETLYKEVWTAPVTEVAKRYQVSDVAIHKICKSLDVPTPPAGYWAKIRAGKEVEKIPLPYREEPATKTGLQSIPKPDVSKDVEDVLGSEPTEEKMTLLTVAPQAQLTGENEKMHHIVAAYRRTVINWKDKKEAEYSQWRGRNKPPAPYLAIGISRESVSRACRIIDSVIKATEPLGWKLTDTLEFIINGETVKIDFSEAQDKVDHVLTKEENRQLLQYEDERKRHPYTSKPQIRKYDYIYNGDLCCSIHRRKTIRPKKNKQLEDYLSEIILDLAVTAEELRQDRLAREEAERKRREDEARKEAIRKRRDAEIDMTETLVREAEDYDTASKIRAYVAAYQRAHPDDSDENWIIWANEKADWYDPTLRREDAFLGKRKPGEKLEEKRSGYRYRC